MKKSLLLLVVLILTGSVFAGEVTLTLRFDRTQLKLGEQDGYTTLSYALAPAMDEVGAPALPELPLHVVVPPTASVTSVEIDNLVEEPLAGEYTVLPRQISRQWRPNDPVPPFVQPRADLYNSSEIYPKDVANAQLTGYKGGFRVSGLLVHPVRFAPAEHKLYFVSQARVRVIYQEFTVPEIRQFARQNQMMGSDLVQTVANPSDIRRFSPAERRHGAFSPYLPAGYFEHVTIAPQVYADSFNQLRDWRTLQGIPSTVMTMEDVCATYPGRDTAEKIRNFIKDADTVWGTIFAFLPRRDYPSREFRAAHVSESGSGPDELPCDLYFSDLDGSWDGNHNNIFGEVTDSVSGYSDVYVGFLPIDGPADIHTFLSKLFRYERNPGANYVRKVSLPVGVTFSQNYTDSIANATPTGWTDFKMYAPGGNKQMFLDSTNAGYGYVAGIHHANQDALYHDSPELINSNDAIGLVGQKLGVFITVGCDPGAWDWVGSVNGDCLAENMISKAQNGWAAVMMNSRSGWVDCAEHYNYEFMYHILPWGPPVCSNMVYVGQGLARAKDHWVPNWHHNTSVDSSLWRCESYERNLFGEPAMPLWNDEPGSVTASHAGVVTIGSGVPYPVTVNTAADAPVDNALVLLWKGSEVYTKGRTNSSGQVTLYVSPQTPGPMILSVNAQNKFLLVDTVHVISTDRYVSYLRSTILDPTPGGNGDSILNPGETVTIPTWVKNWGQQSASGVTGKLRTHDANAQIIDSMKTFGTINAGDSATTGSGGFGLQVNTGLVNGYAVACSLICRDALDSVWVSNLTFYVGSPVLAFQTFTVRDSVRGNGNGKIDPGEVSDLVVSIKNTGMGHGYNCSAVLRSGDPRFIIQDSSSAYGYVAKGATADNLADMFVVYATSAIPMETSIPCTLYTYADGGYVGTAVFSIVVGEIRSVDPIPDGPRTPALYYAYDDVDVNYPSHPTYNWIELRGRGTRLTLSDDQTVQVGVPSGFGPLRYYGNSYTQISVCGNGFVGLGSMSANAWGNVALPTTTLPGPVVCANWDDLYPPVGGGVWWMHDTASHALVVEWDSVAYYSPQTTSDKFEIVFFDTTVHAPTTNNVIQVQYKTANNYASNTVGIQDPTQAIAINALANGSYHRGCAALAPSRAIKFTTDNPTAIAEETSDLVLTLTDFAAYPNPFRGLGNVAWQVRSAGRVSLSVYDLSGRVVRDLVAMTMKPGRYSVTWDGKANDGRTVSTGIYFYKLTTSAGTLQQKVVVTR